MSQGFIKLIKNDKVQDFEQYAVRRGYDVYDVSSFKKYLEEVAREYKEYYGDENYSYTFKEVNKCGPYLHKTKRDGEDITQEYLGMTPKDVEEKL